MQDGFGNRWRAYGDGRLRKTSLDVEEAKILAAMDNKKNGAISVDPDTNWDRAKAAVGAAFKQLHYQAQRFDSRYHQVNDSLGDFQTVLAANRTPTGLRADELAAGQAAAERSLDQALAVSVQGKLDFMHNYVPIPAPIGPDVLQNHPPLFLANAVLNTGAKAYFVDKPSLGMKRVLVLKWHTGVEQTIQRPFSDLYYLALYTHGAATEGWISQDDNRVVGILDGLPKP